MTSKTAHTDRPGGCAVRTTLAAVTYILVATFVCCSAEECDLKSADSPIRDDVIECEDLARKFLMKISSARHKTKDQVICESYYRFRECLSPLMENCTNIETTFYKDWSAIDDMMDCTCRNKTDECAGQLRCLVQESGSVLVDRCGVMYRFMKKQRVFDECSLLQDAVMCPAALVRSQCGEEAGDVRFELQKLHALYNERAAAVCPIKRRFKHYKGFRYSGKCPKDLVKRVYRCLDRHVWGRKALFHEQNDLILAGAASSIPRMCRAHERFRKCLDPIQSHCGEGVAQILQLEQRDRVYLLKLDIICSDAADAYAENLTCLQQTIQNNSLSVCNDIWYHFSGFLERVSAYMFYCDARPENTTIQYKVHSGLGRLRDCYERVFANSCGDGEATVMRQLMDVVFDDPYYLKLKYRPKCDAKLKEKKTTTSSPTTLQTHKVITRSRQRNVAYVRSDACALEHWMRTLLLCLALSVLYINR